MGWKPYHLDHLAQEIVLNARSRDKKANTDSLNQAYKMRSACAYGLERFWGEHLRLADNEKEKAAFVADVWKAFVGIINTSGAGIVLPGTMLSNKDDEAKIQDAAKQIWQLDPEAHQVCLAVLVSLCDSIVWWTQRLKLPKKGES